MTKKIVWRLGTAPDVDDVKGLVDSGIITKEEAREIVLREEEQPKKATPSEIDDVKKEVELLRELVLGLAAKRDATTIIHKYVDRWNYPWTKPYVYYCSTQGTVGGTVKLGGAQYSTYTSASNSLLK